MKTNTQNTWRKEEIINKAQFRFYAAPKMEEGLFIRKSKTLVHNNIF
jgi:hypothetical protein